MWRLFSLSLWGGEGGRVLSILHLLGNDWICFLSKQVQNTGNDVSAFSPILVPILWAINWNGTDLTDRRVEKCLMFFLSSGITIQKLSWACWTVLKIRWVSADGDGFKFSCRIFDISIGCQLVAYLALVRILWQYGKF